MAGLSQRLVSVARLRYHIALNTSRHKEDVLISSYRAGSWDEGFAQERGLSASRGKGWSLPFSRASRVSNLLYLNIFHFQQPFFSAPFRPLQKKLQKSACNSHHYVGYCAVLFCSLTCPPTNPARASPEPLPVTPPLGPRPVNVNVKTRLLRGRSRSACRGITQHRQVISCS